MGASLMDFGTWVAGLGPLLGNEASQNKQRDTSLANDQQVVSDRNRTAVGTEWSGGRSHGHRSVDRAVR